jgi:hypothetical protein
MRLRRRSPATLFGRLRFNQFRQVLGELFDLGDKFDWHPWSIDLVLECVEQEQGFPEALRGGLV